MRRILIGVVAALLVARPLVLGEDPGMLIQADTASITLTLFWFMALTAWAVWRFWFKRPEFRAGVVELCLCGFIAVLFLAAIVAATYKHPARLIAWEWCGFLAALLVVRQLSISPEERHGLYCVLLASCVSLSAQGVYQYVEEFPVLRKLANDPIKLRQKMAEKGVPIEPENFKARLLMDHVFATYAHPNTYAGYLALTIPGLVAAVWLARRGPHWRLALTGACAALGVSALLLTHSRGALLALATASGIAALLFGWRVIWKHRIAFVVGVVVLAGGGYLALKSGAVTAGFGKGTETMAVRLDYWSAAWKIIRAHPWLGVGSGNFGRTYPQYMAETAVEKIKEPHNFMFEEWAEAGPFALGFLLAALGYLLFRVYRAVLVPPAEDPPNEEASAGPSIFGKRWEYLAGGLIGTLIVMGLWLGDNSPGVDEMIVEGAKATLRIVFWFLAYAIFERLPWTDRVRSVAGAIGLTALLLNLCVSDGISAPQLAVLFWAVAGLALNVSSKPAAWAGPGRISLLWPLVAFLAVLIGFFTFAFNPIFSAASYSREAQKAMKLPAPEVRTPQVTAQLHLAAEKGDPTDSRLWISLGDWLAEFYRLHPLAQRHYTDLPAAQEARRLDPANKAGYLITYRYYEAHAGLAFREGNMQADKAKALDRAEVGKNEYLAAANVLAPFVAYDPTEADVHYLLARAYFFAEEKAEPGLWQKHAHEALRLDEIQRKQPLQPARTLEAAQRNALEVWLKADGIRGGLP